MTDSLQQPGRALRHPFEGPFYRRLVLSGVRWIPRPLQFLSLPLWAGLFHAALPTARRAAAANLDQVLGPASAWQRSLRSFRVFLNYAQMLTDGYAMHLGRTPPVTIRGREHLLAAVRSGRGAIAVTGHLGLWQAAPFLAELDELPPFVMAMAEEPDPRVQAFEERLRGRFRVLYTTGSPLASLELLAVLRAGSILGMQMDRHLGTKLAAIPFCGRPAWFSLGPATLSLVSGAPIVPTFFVVEPDLFSPRRRAVLTAEEPIFVPRGQDRDRAILDATERMVKVYERYVRRYARQWFNFFDFWRAPERPAAPTLATFP